MSYARQKMRICSRGEGNMARDVMPRQMDGISAGYAGVVSFVDAIYADAITTVADSRW